MEQREELPELKLGDKNKRPDKTDNKNGLLILECARNGDKKGLRELLAGQAHSDTLITPAQQAHIYIYGLTATTDEPVTPAELLYLNREKEAATLIIICAVEAGNYVYAEGLYAEVTTVAEAIPPEVVRDKKKLFLLLVTGHPNYTQYRYNLLKALDNVYKSEEIPHLTDGSLYSSTEYFFRMVEEETCKQSAPLDPRDLKLRVKLISMLSQLQYGEDLPPRHIISALIDIMMKFKTSPAQTLYLFYERYKSTSTYQKFFIGQTFTISEAEREELANKTNLHQKIDELDRNCFKGGDPSHSSLMTFLNAFYGTVAPENPHMLAHALKYVASYCQALYPQNPSAFAGPRCNLREQGCLVSSVAEEKAASVARYKACIDCNVKLFFKPNQRAEMEQTTIALRDKGIVHEVVNNDNNDNNDNNEMELTVKFGIRPYPW